MTQVILISSIIGENRSKYPALSKEVNDVLSFNYFAPDSTFSTSGGILHPYQQSLSPKMVDTLICAQSWTLITERH